MTGSLAAVPPAALAAFATLDSCVQCGFCLPTCPTYRETYREQSSPRGRIQLMLAVRGRSLDALDPTFAGQMDECLDCRACETACPSAVRYGQALESARALVADQRRERGAGSATARILDGLVFDWLFHDLGRLRGVASLAHLYQRSGLRSLARRSGLPRLFGLDRLERLLPAAPGPYVAPRGQVIPAVGERRGRVGLLAGCVMSTAFASVDRATVRVLARNGWEVALPAGQGCCGALQVHAGHPAAARDLARHNIAAFEAAGVEYVVSNAAGCGAALKEYEYLLHDDPNWARRAAALSTRARDVSELLAAAPLRGPLGRLDVTATYQDACHLSHAQRVSTAPRALLTAIPGLRLVEMAEAALCCGGAGLYAVTRPEMSDRLQRRKLGKALATGARIILSGNPGCMLQLRAGLEAAGRTDIAVRHVVEALDAAYRRAPLA